MQFKDKVVIVTGATSEFGEPTCIKFAKEGATVILVGKNEDTLSNVKELCDAEGPPAYIITADLTNDEEAKKVIEETVRKFNKIDVLVNTVMILYEGNIIDSTIINVFDEVMQTNVRTVVNLTSFATPYLIESKGNIVNLSTIGGERVVCVQYGLVCMSNAAVNHFTRAAAIELGKSGVRVNSVSAGFSTSDTIMHNTLIDDWADPEEIADMILFLASDDSKSITGSNIVCDNGGLATQKTVLD